MARIRFLKIGLAFVLSYVGVKMLLAFFGFEIPIILSLLVIVGIIALSVAASLLIKGEKIEVFRIFFCSFLNFSIFVLWLKAELIHIA